MYNFKVSKGWVTNSESEQALVCNKIHVLIISKNILVSSQPKKHYKAEI
jgi:hypothetical protein